MINRERKIEDLRKSLKGKVYIYLKDTETCKRFLRDAENEGYRFGTIRPTENSTDDIIALGHRKQLSYVGFVGHVAWMCNGGTDAIGKFHRIDYDKYISGEDDFYFKSRPLIEKINLNIKSFGKVTVIGKDREVVADYLKQKLILCKSESEILGLFDEIEETFETLIIS